MNSGETRASLTSVDASLARFRAAFAPSERTLPQMLARQAARFSERTLVKAGGETWTFSQTLDIAGGMAARLAQAGVAPGDRVAILRGNGPAILQAYLGCAFAGAIAAPINVASRGAQLEHIFKNCGAKLAVVDADLLPAVIATAGCGAPLAKLWVVGESDLEIPGLRPRRCPRRAKPSPPASLAARRYGGDPLHLGHDRAVERRLLPAGAIFLVGCATPRRCSASATTSGC